MRRWGIIITAFYAAVVLILSVPVLYFLVFRAPTMDGLLEVYKSWGIWVYAGIIVAGEALLLFLSVDTSWRHAKPRQYVAVTVIYTSFFAALLTWAAIISLTAAFKYWPEWEQSLMATIAVVLVPWLIWVEVFYHFYRDSSNMVSRIVTWLLRGSVLELLIAVPAHVIVRQRGECTAPAFTGFGIVTGLSIMLLCFGSGVLALYKKRLDAYSKTRRNGSRQAPAP